MIDQPLTLPCGATLKNRLAKAAMTEGLADQDDQPTDRHRQLYTRWSDGGPGLLITGNVMVDKRFLERPGNVVIDHDYPVDHAALNRWAKSGQNDGCAIWMQISHPGRQCSSLASRRPLAVSDVQLKLGGLFGKPIPMGELEIEDAIERYVFVANTAKQCGFDGVQIHAAHGYLISQFLSPVTNTRRDEWGGALEKRARFLLEVIQRTRAAVGPEFPIGVKLNSADFQKGGFSFEDCQQVAQRLDKAGIDLLEISGGTYEQPRLLGVEGKAETVDGPSIKDSTRRREAFFLDYAKAMQAVVDTPLMVTGGFRSLAAMRTAINAGEADVIGLGRPLCADAQAPQQLLAGEIEELVRYESRLAKRGVFSANSKVFLLKLTNVLGSMAWYYRRIVELAENRPVQRQAGLVPSILKHQWTEVRVARARSFRNQ